MREQLFDDGTNIRRKREEQDYDPQYRNSRHYSEQTGHLLRGFSVRFASILEISAEYRRLVRSRMRRVTRDGKE